MAADPSMQAASFGSFNCAAPFRERLLAVNNGMVYVPDTPSIVPLPFGSGYGQRGRCPVGVALSPSIVPLPFGSGYA